jgi:hypothetical protein
MVIFYNPFSTTDESQQQNRMTDPPALTNTIPPPKILKVAPPGIKLSSFRF